MSVSPVQECPSETQIGIRVELVDEELLEEFSPSSGSDDITLRVRESLGGKEEGSGLRASLWAERDGMGEDTARAIGNTMMDSILSGSG